MKSLLKLAVASALFACLSSQAMAFEPVPHKLNVQGVLRNVAGEVVTGAYNVTFSIYPSIGATVPIHGPELQTLTVTGGVFSAYIGPINPAAVFVDKGEAWLGIKVGADPELPRKPLTAVGFAMQAEHAERADELIGAATDVNCTTTPCIGANEVTFNWAAGTSAGGPAADVSCVGCVTGTEIANLTILTANLADGSVTTVKLAAGAVDSTKLAANAVLSGNIADGQVLTGDIGDSAVTSAKIAANAVGAAQLGVNYALSDAKGGEALSLKCDNVGCVNSTEVSFTYANSATKGGDASGLACVNCVDSSEVSFNYAASTGKGGPATGLACTDCVTAGMVQFPYAAGNSENGAAIDLACSGGGACVDSSEVNFFYAASTAKGGPATDVACTGCIEAGSLGFNWAAGVSPGGDASGLTCTGCVGANDVENLSIGDAKIVGPITGSKIQLATPTTVGVVKVGAGLAVDGTGLLTPFWGTAAGTVAQGNHVHPEYFSTASDIVLAFGKKFKINDQTDPETAYYSYFMQGSGAGDNQSGVNLVLGYQGTDANFFRVITESSAWSGKAFEVTAAGNAFVKGNLTFGTGAGYPPPAGGPEIVCEGCAKIRNTNSDNRVIQDGSVTGIDIRDGTVGAGDLDPALALNTTGSITSSTAMYAPIYYDSNNTSYYADPNLTSRMNTINYDALRWAANTAYGLVGSQLYTSHINQGGPGTTLYIGNTNCGSIDVFNGCGGNTMFVRGNIQANIMYDLQDTSFYVDPNNVSRLRYVNTGNDSWFPYHGNGWNYLRGHTNVANVLYDEQDNGYYIDMNSVSRLGLLYTNGLRLYNSWPGDPYGFAQFANSSGHLYMGPDANVSQMVIMRQGNDDRIYYMLGNGTNVNRPSFRTDGGHLVINSSTNNKNLYLQWDVGGNVQVNGQTWSHRFVDGNDSAYCIDPNGASQIYNLWAPYLRGYQAYFSQGLRVDSGSGGNGLAVWGSGGNSTWSQLGITLNNWAGIYPAGNGMGMVGHSSRTFWGLHAVNHWGWSNREYKKDIEYLGRDEMNEIGDKLHALKPARWFYKQELVDQAGEDTPADYVRQQKHIGLILDEMPADITAGGQAWSINDSVGFLLTAGKYLEDENRQHKARIRDLEDRIALMEQALVDAGILK